MLYDMDENSPDLLLQVLHPSFFMGSPGDERITQCLFRLLRMLRTLNSLIFFSFLFFTDLCLWGLFLGLYTLVKNEQKLSELNFLSLKAVKQLNSWLLGTWECFSAGGCDLCLRGMESFQWIEAVAWVSELNIGHWHDGLSSPVSSKPCPLNERGDSVGARIKSWENPAKWCRYRSLFHM